MSQPSSHLLPSPPHIHLDLSPLRLVPYLLRFLVPLFAQRKWRRRAVLQLSRARGPPRKIGVTTSTERLRRVALAYVLGVTLDVPWQILDGRSLFFSGSAMSLAPSSINPEKRIPRETKKGNLLLLYARNLTAFCTYFNEHTLTLHRNCVTTLAHSCRRHLPTYVSISHPSDSSHICFVF